MLHQLSLCYSWLLADPEMKVRSNYQGYQEAITQFFGNLLPRVVDLQVGVCVCLLGNLLPGVADLQVGMCAFLAICCLEWLTCRCVYFWTLIQNQASLCDDQNNYKFK